MAHDRAQAPSQSCSRQAGMAGRARNACAIQSLAVQSRPVPWMALRTCSLKAGFPVSLLGCPSPTSVSGPQESRYRALPASWAVKCALRRVGGSPLTCLPHEEQPPPREPEKSHTQVKS